MQVRNGTDRELQVFLVYLDENGKGDLAWLPAAGDDTQPRPLPYTVPPGEAVVLSLFDRVPVLTSRVRVWAQANAEQWLTYRDEDLVLVRGTISGGRTVGVLDSVRRELTRPHCDRLSPDTEVSGLGH